MQLKDIVVKKIHDEGPISFHDYMEMCLYYPECGYYTSRTEKIGSNGDFYTTANISSLLGISLGKQFEEMWANMGRKEFTIVEYGAGTGMLCRDILGYLKQNALMYDRLNYFIIEKSAAMRQKEKTLLSSKVQWVDSIRDIAPLTGCIFSNELLDNFAVHRIVMLDRLMEIFVDHQEGFAEMLRPASKEIEDYFSQLNIVLPRGYQSEINLEAKNWLKEISACMKKGYLITIDYGHPSSKLYQSSRRDGTLLCYHKHQINDDPYDHIGEQDITAHVNFSALDHWGNNFGLRTCEFTCQANFLLSLGWEEHSRQLLSDENNRQVNFQRYAWLKNNLLLDIGQRLKVMIQCKGTKPPRRRLQAPSAVALNETFRPRSDHSDDERFN